MRYHWCFVLIWPVCQAVAAVEVPLTVVRGFPLVRVSVGGGPPHLFLLDTGAASTLVDPALATTAEWIHSGEVEVVTATGKSAAPMVRVDLEMAGVAFGPVDAVRADLAAVRRVDRRIRGILGQNVLQRMNYVLDLDARRLLIEEAGDLEAELSGPRQTVEWIRGRPAIRIQGMRLVLDTGASHIVLFRPGTGVGGTMHTVNGAGGISLQKRGQTRFSDVAVLAGRQPGRVEDGLLPASVLGPIYVNNVLSYVVFIRDLPRVSARE
ncbi:MAG: clan AA aspartic protease [Bryobacterales bacterium]|nr:clan AA aspartic protease [Bryobacterales bacterium]